MVIDPYWSPAEQHQFKQQQLIRVTIDRWNLVRMFQTVHVSHMRLERRAGLQPQSLVTHVEALCGGFNKQNQSSFLDAA